MTTPTHEQIAAWASLHGLSDIDDELRGLATQALLNGFYRRFGQLVDEYLDLAEGLVDDPGLFMLQLAEKSSVFSRFRPPAAQADYLDPEVTNVVQVIRRGRMWANNHDTLLAALSDPEAEQVILNGRTVFRRENGEWVCGEE